MIVMVDLYDSNKASAIVFGTVTDAKEQQEILGTSSYQKMMEKNFVRTYDARIKAQATKQQMLQNGVTLGTDTFQYVSQNKHTYSGSVF